MTRLSSADRLGADPTQNRPFAGDSAGGHLAAVTAQQGGLSTAAPRLPFFSCSSIRSPDLCGDLSLAPDVSRRGFVLTKENMDWYEEQFVGPDLDRRDPRASHHC